MNQQSLQHFDIKKWNQQAKGFCNKRGVSGELVDDLIQNTWTTFLKDQSHFKRRSSLSTFLFGILRFKVLEHLRGVKKTKELNERVLSLVQLEDSMNHRKFPQEEVLWQQQSRYQLDKVFQTLSPKQQAVLAHRHNEVFSFKSPLPVSKGNECVIYHRSKKTLKRALVGWF